MQNWILFLSFHYPSKPTFQTPKVIFSNPLVRVNQINLQMKVFQNCVKAGLLTLESRSSF